MLEKFRLFFNRCFSSLEATIKTLIFFLIPFMVFFMILSDRNPYNYITIVFYVIQILLIIFYIFIYRFFVFDLLSLLLVCILFSILVSQLLNFSIAQFPRTILFLSAFSIIFYQFLITLNNNEKTFVFKLMIIGGLLFVIFFVIYYFKDLISLDFSERLGRDFSDQNDLAKNLAVFAILSLVLIFKTSKWRKIFYIFATLIFAFFILVTGSISNLLVLIIIAVAALFYLVIGKKKLWVLLGIAVFFGLFIALLQLPFMSYFKTRILNMFNSFFSSSGSVDNSFVDRFYLAMYGLRLFTSKPIFGYGYDQVQYYTWGKNAFSHNNFIELLGSFGLIGFLIFEAILLIPLVKNWKKKDAELSLFALLYLFLFQMFLVIFRKKIEYFIIPLSFSFIDYHAFKHFTLSINNKKLSFKMNVPFNGLHSKNDYCSIDI